jgi:hypothetical protein
MQNDPISIRRSWPSKRSQRPTRRQNNTHGWLGDPTDKERNFEFGAAHRVLYPWDRLAIRGHLPFYPQKSVFSPCSIRGS